MKKEIINTETVCDLCRQTLYDPGTRMNDGSFQEPYFTQGKIDLCWTCLGKLVSVSPECDLDNQELDTMLEKSKKVFRNESIHFIDLPIPSMI